MSRPRDPKKPDVGRLLDRLAGEEQQFLERELLAPVLPGGKVRVRIGGAACEMNVEPADFSGWGVFRPLDHRRAEFVRRAGLAERRRYLELFPRVRLIVCRRAGDAWLGAAASFGDRRIRLEGLAPVALAEEVQLFDCAATRFDGAHFWFEEIDQRRDPAAAAYLRQSLAAETEPAELARPGLTAEERASYELAFWELVQPPDSEHADDDRQEDAPRDERRRRGPGRYRERRYQHSSDGDPHRELDPVAARLRATLSHAGAQLVGYLERGDSFRVTYNVGGRQYTSAVDKHDLTVQVAGVCLSGQDRKFDLASLVGVLREGEGDHLVAVGDENHGMDEDLYWRMHPRRNR